MAKQLLTERVADLGRFAARKAAGQTLPFTPLQLAHVYIKFDFKHQFENARSADDAKGFLRSVARAAMAAQEIASQYGGVLLEVQGSTLHVGLPRSASIVETTEMDATNAFVGDLHWAYRVIFNDAKLRVEGWRIAVDAGKTLIVAGRGVHGDDSWVSLGKAANRPAKHLYAQLELPEELRELKRFYVAVRDPLKGRWIYGNLDHAKQRLKEAAVVAEQVRRVQPKLDFLEPISRQKLVTARAEPLGPRGTPASPSPDQPHTYWGWVTRIDLDGFTARVEACLDNDQRLAELAAKFYGIMDAAAVFVELHKETLVQLPWAGDNFTAAAVFPGKPEYDLAVPTRLVELSLDFEKQMCAAATDCGFGGWAHGVAGGDVHGNASANVYVAGVEVTGRRFLVGAGEGFGRSTQAFGDIDPQAQEIVVYKPDFERLTESYKKLFEPAVNYRGEQSSVYRITTITKLVGTRARQASQGVPTTITYPGGQTQSIPPKPHWK